MDIRDKQKTDVIRRILTALGTDRGLSDDVGVTLNSLGQIILHTVWHRPGGKKYIVESTVTVASRWIQVEGMTDPEDGST